MCILSLPDNPTTEESIYKKKCHPGVRIYVSLSAEVEAPEGQSDRAELMFDIRMEIRHLRVEWTSVWDTTGASCAARGR